VRRRRVLFVCIGNSCRSQMAEGFARAYGSDVLVAESAGLSPALDVSALTQAVMLEKNIDLGSHHPKGLEDVNLPSVDLIVNMSGAPLPAQATCPVREWDVRDPIGGNEQLQRQVAAQIENLVMQLVLELRSQADRHRR